MDEGFEIDLKNNGLDGSLSALQERGMLYRQENHDIRMKLYLLNTDAECALD